MAPKKSVNVTCEGDCLKVALMCPKHGNGIGICRVLSERVLKIFPRRLGVQQKKTFNLLERSQ